MVIVTPAAEVGSDHVAVSAMGTPESKKTSKIETSSDKASDMRRLVEYFVVVSPVRKDSELAENDGDAQGGGIMSTVSFEAATDQTDRDGVTRFSDDDEEHFVEDLDFVPKITARYPLKDWKNNPLHESVTYFCHPMGSIQVRTEMTMPKIHFFVATGGTGKKMYGTCLTLWEPYIITAKTNKGNYARKEAFLPKCLVIQSTYPYLIAFREFLTQLNRLSKMGEMTLPVERYIANFCSEIPAPPPGAFEVQTTILDSVIKIWSPPHNQPIAWVALPFSHLFECLDIDNIILVWHCLVLERQVLLTSTQLSLLTVCAEILISILFPMKWSHAYIPILPHFLVPMLSAPMPFLCGIDKTNLASALCDLSGECVVVDLDMNLVTLGPSTEPLPPLPVQMEEVLKARLDENVGMVFRGARGLTKNDDYSEAGMHLPQHVKLMSDAMWESRLCLFDEAFHLFYTPEEFQKNVLNGNDTSGMEMRDLMSQLPKQRDAEKRSQSQWDSVQEAFVDAFVYLLRNYRKFLVFPSKENEGAYGGAGFRSKDFVSQQRYDMQEFLQQMIGTQMFDNFVTKRLYGSGEADVAFFDSAVDRFLKNAGLLSNVDVAGRFRRSVTSNSAPRFSLRKGKVDPSLAASLTSQNKGEPLLQSAKVHRKLKTIVPPEPSSDNLPPLPLGNLESGLVVSEHQDDEDSRSVRSEGSSSTQETSTTSGSKRSSTIGGVGSPRQMRSYKSVQDKAAAILEKSKYRYTYPTFPADFNTELFGEPRPLPASVLEEFERQRKDAARFRRKANKAIPNGKDKNGGQLKRLDGLGEPQPNAEVSTFTLFFMAFSSMVGKDLMDISDNPLLAQEKTILATYTHPGVDSMYDLSDVETDDEGTTLTTSSTQDGEDEDPAEREGVAEMKATRPSMMAMLDDDEDYEGTGKSFQSSPTDFSKDDDNAVASEVIPEAPKVNLDDYLPPPEEEDKEKSKPKSRFTQTLSKLQIEEAKATGRAQLALAFEMLTMMKKRGLKADPEAYQVLIDACGRVGDTKRATELLSKMHEDGIVADGVVYSCLVAAFSVDSAWKDNKNDEEDLPEWANSTAVEMDWNKLQEKSLLDKAKESVNTLVAKLDDEEEDDGEQKTTVQRLRRMWSKRLSGAEASTKVKKEAIEFFVTEPVEMQIELGENLLEIVYPDISVDTDNETCPRCNFLLSDDDVVAGWTPNDSQDYTTKCPNCTQRFVPHFCVQSTSSTFMGSRGPASPLLCERLSPWVLKKEIRSVMADREGIENLLNPEWREQENKNAILWWNLVLSCMRYRFPFSFLLQGSFDQNLISPMPEMDD